MAFERTFRNDKIDIKDNFLEAVQNKLSHLAPNVKKSTLECYLYINNEVRAANVDALRNLKSDTAAAILWEGAFLRLPRSVSGPMFCGSPLFQLSGQADWESRHLALIWLPYAMRKFRRPIMVGLSLPAKWAFMATCLLLITVWA